MGWSQKLLPAGCKDTVGKRSRKGAEKGPAASPPFGRRGKKSNPNSRETEGFLCIPQLSMAKPRRLPLCHVNERAQGQGLEGEPWWCRTMQPVSGSKSACQQKFSSLGGITGWGTQKPCPEDVSGAPWAPLGLGLVRVEPPRCNSSFWGDSSWNRLGSCYLL